MNIYYIYRYVRLDTNIPFYVGKGSKNRAFSLKSRNRYFKHIIKVKPFKVEIILKNLSEDAAFKKEKEFISLYKKFNMCEANLTLGGEGVSGVKVSDELKEKRRINALGVKNPMFGKTSAMKNKKHKKESLIKLSNSLKLYNKNNPRKLTDKHKENISKGVKGKLAGDKHPFFGLKNTDEYKNKMSKNHPRNKKIIDINTNIEYVNIREAANAFGIKRSTLKQYLSGLRKNKTTLRYL